VHEGTRKLGAGSDNLTDKQGEGLVCRARDMHCGESRIKNCETEGHVIGRSIRFVREKK